MTLWRPFFLYWLNKNGYCSAPSWVLYMLKETGQRYNQPAAAGYVLRDYPHLRCGQWCQAAGLGVLEAADLMDFFTISVPRVYSVWWKTKTIQWGNNLLRRGTEVRLLGADKKAALTQWTAFFTGKTAEHKSRDGIRWTAENRFRLNFVEDDRKLDSWSPIQWTAIPA